MVELNKVQERSLGFFSSVEWKLALRYLIPRRKRAFTSVISIISFTGILIGVWALIVVMSVMNGFRAELLNRILGLNGHVVVQSIDNFSNDYESYVNKLRRINQIVNVFPIVEGQVLLQTPYGRSSGALVRGLTGNDLANLKAVSSNILSGSLANFDKENFVVLGAGLAERLGLRVGEDLTLLSPEGDATPFGVNPRVKTYKIGAIYKVGMSEFDSTFLFLPLSEAQLFFNLQGQVKALEIFLANPDRVDEVLPIIQTIMGDESFVTDWRQQNRAFFSALQVEKNVMFLILSLIILVAALNIISGLVMLVKDKGHDIAVLRTMGAEKATIMRVFILIGLTIGISGTFFGVILAIVTCLNIGEIQAFVSWLFGVDVFNSDLYFLSQLPAQLSLKQVLSVVIMSVTLSFLAALFPAWRAARLDPVQALRYE